MLDPEDPLYYSTNQMIRTLPKAESCIKTIPDLFKSIFLVLMEVATGNEYSNSNYLNLNSLPLGFHSAVGPGKYQPTQTNETDK